jgi:hypothetical protein
VAQLNFPQGVTTNRDNKVFIADTNNNVIRMVSSDGIIVTVAGNGNAAYCGDGGSTLDASLQLPRGVTISATGEIYVADSGNNCIRKIFHNGTIITVAGTGIAGFSGDGGPSLRAQLKDPYSVALLSTGEIYIADRSNDRIRNMSCDPGNTGYDCELNICYGINESSAAVCSGHGICQLPDHCMCESGYTGYNCWLTQCYSLNQTSSNVCLGHGECQSPDHCICKDGYKGNDCQSIECYGVNQTSPNVC